MTATACDSVGAGNPFTRFRVEALNIAGTHFWYSAVDSGYSVDNLPHSALGQLTPAQYRSQVEPAGDPKKPALRRA